MANFAKKIKWYFTKTDIVLWLLVIAAMMYSLVLISSMQRSTEYNVVNTQIIAIVIGLIIAIIISCIDYKYLLQLWWVFAIISLLLLGLLFVFGHKAPGTDDVAWLKLGPISIQPSEYVKVFFVITFTKHLDYLVKEDKLKTLVGIISLFIHMAIPVAIIHFQGEDGSVLILIFIFIIMMFAGGVQLRYFLIMSIILAAGIPLLWNFFLTEQHKGRILALFDLDGNSVMDYGWQQYQGKISIASGGLQGSGLANGERVESYIVPEQENDFIFTVAGEELGFIGCVILLLILLLIIIKVIFDATKAKDYSGKMICIGIFSILATQIIINIGMVLGLLPVVGITLPFFSSGGTSMIAILMAVGLVQSVYIHKDDIEESNGVLKNNKYKYIPNKNNLY